MLKFLLLIIFAIVESLIIGLLLFTIHNKKFQLRKYSLFCFATTILIVLTKQLPINFLISLFFNLCILSVLCSYIYKINVRKASLTSLLLMILLLFSEVLSEIALFNLPIKYVDIICENPMTKLMYSYIAAHTIYAVFAIVIYIFFNNFKNKQCNYYIKKL